MARVAACNVTEGFVFEVKSQDSSLTFGMSKNEYEEDPFSWISKNIDVPIGTRVIVTKKPYKENPSQMVDWKFEDGDGTEYKSFWSIFKNNSKLVEGVVEETRKPLKGLSSGKYAGFDMEISSVDINNYCEYLGFVSVEINIKFIGEIQGAKKINTKLINQIKRSEDFKKDFLDLVLTTLEDRYREQILSYIDESVEERSETNYDLNNGLITTWYSGGKLQYTILFGTRNFNTIREYILHHIDIFIESNSTHTCYTKKMYSEINN